MFIDSEKRLKQLSDEAKKNTLKKQPLTNRRKRSILGKGVACNATPFGGVGAKP
jgi:hypothetical protein